MWRQSGGAEWWWWYVEEIPCVSCLPRQGRNSSSSQSRVVCGLLQGWLHGAACYGWPATVGGSAYGPRKVAAIPLFSSILPIPMIQFHFGSNIYSWWAVLVDQPLPWPLFVPLLPGELQKSGCLEVAALYLSVCMSVLLISRCPEVSFEGGKPC